MALETNLAYIRKDPRKGGEICTELASKQGLNELSPHRQGRPDLLISESDIFRKIPACAGRTRNRQSAYRSAWNDPRWRGEDDGEKVVRYPTFGKIPARSGKTIIFLLEHFVL